MNERDARSTLASEVSFLTILATVPAHVMPAHLAPCITYAKQRVEKAAQAWASAHIAEITAIALAEARANEAAIQEKP